MPKFRTFNEKKNSKFRKRTRLLLELEPLGENVKKKFFLKNSRKKKSEIFEKKKFLKKRRVYSRNVVQLTKLVQLDKSSRSRDP